MNVRYDTAKKLAHLVEYLPIYWTDYHRSTSSKNLVNFYLLTPEITGLICIPMYLHWAKIDLTPAFVVLTFRNAKEYCYAEGCINSSNDQATSDINLVGFRLVSPKLMRINCVQ